VSTALKEKSTFKVAQPTRNAHALRPHPENPREDVSFNDPSIQSLATSIINSGVIEPLVVTPEGFVVAGHRRRMAAIAAAQRTGNKDFLNVPVVVRDVPPEQVVELMLAENMQRKSLTLLEEARALRSMLEQRGGTVIDLVRSTAETLGLDMREVSQRLAILKCEPEVQLLFGRGELSPPAAPWLARVLVASKQVDYAGMLARRQITMEKLKEYATAPVAPPPPVSKLEQERAADIPERAPARLPPTQAVRGARAAAKQIKDAAEAVQRGAPPTRKEAVEALQRSMYGKEKKTKITLFNFQRLVEDLCCSCGMAGHEDVCRTCPFPRLVLAVAGRAD
jgi:ParB/RepB/Spo0J family partition protein